MRSVDRNRNSRPDADVLPGEPGVGVDLPDPFRAHDPDTAWMFALNRMGIRPGLSRIRGLLADLGDPQIGLRTLVVAGTNGKGSTTRILARLLRAAGYRVATYTSPHLLQVTERIQIDEQSLSVDEFRRRVRSIRPLVERHQASWFESLTALAVQAAADAGVDFLCCETGLGGRLDASNALPSQAVLLTGIGLDHEHILGETLPEIAAEKLGLLKPQVPLFCALPSELKAQAFTAAVQIGAPCYFLDELARWPDAGEQPGSTWDLVLRERVLTGLPDHGMPFLRRNTALALLALDELESRLDLELVPEDAGGALGNLFLPGRYQHVLTRPDWIFDTAHNTQALTAALERFLARPRRGRRVLLLGGMRDKTWGAEVLDLIGRVDEVMLASISLPRSRSRQELESLAQAWNGATVAVDLGRALTDLTARLSPDDTVLVTGSCFLVAEALYRMGYDTLDSTLPVREAASVTPRSNT